MWIVKLALDRPYTFVVTAILVLLMGGLAVIPYSPLATPVDIFPNINIPVVSIIWNYTGFSPQDMEGHIVSITERALTTTVNDIEHIESTSYNGVAVVKVYFHPNVKIDMAVAQITAVSQTQLKQLPAGSTPPLILQYSASSVPIVQMSLSSPSQSEQTLNDLSLNFVRPRLTTIEGAAIPYPYGGKQRLVSVDIDIPALQARGLTPNDVVTAISAQNLILPSGTAKIGPLEYDIAMNGSPITSDDLNNIPVKVQNGAIIYLRDVAHVRDGFSPQTNIVRQNGVRSTLLSIIKNGDVSTLKIVDDVNGMIPKLKAIVPDDVEIKTLFDQSLFVKASIKGVVLEATIAAFLTAMMILLFLGDWRSTLIIAVSIPLSILSSIIILSALGETLNIMTLGGLALAVGILVDDATVTIENIDNYLERGFKKREAIRPGVRLLHLYLHRLRADVRALRRRALSLRPAGRVGRVRGDGFLLLLAHARADACDVPDEGRARRGRRTCGGWARRPSSRRKCAGACGRIPEPAPRAARIAAGRRRAPSRRPRRRAGALRAAVRDRPV